MEIEAPAKINLSLFVEEKREDGFHNIKTIFQTISLYDKIKIFPSEGLSVSCSSIRHKENLVYKACLSLLKYTEYKKGAKIIIKKHIPISAGLGGGSSDCANTILGLNRFWDLSLSKNSLKKIGGSLGADVPFFLERGTCLGEGIGTELTKLHPIPDCFFLLVFFPFKVSTKEVYEKVKSQKSRVKTQELGVRSQKIEDMILAIENGNLEGIARNLHNDLESVTFNIDPEISKIKEYLIKEGALNALMSGSGPTIFGIFKKKMDAIVIKKRLALSGIKAKIVKPVNI